jgi:hypothetical protein
MNTLAQLVDIIAEHPFASLFLVMCVAWVVNTTIAAIKPCDCGETKKGSDI